MIALARISDKGPMSAAVVAAALLLAAVLVPRVLIAGGGAGLAFFGSIISMGCLIASAAVVAFVALRHGEMAALKVTGGCLLLLVVASLVIYGTAVLFPIIAIVFWLPAIIAAFVLARTVKLDQAVLAIVACGVSSVLLFSLATGDPAAFWRSQFGDVGDAFTTLSSQAGGSAIVTEQMLEEFITSMSNLMTGAMGVSVMSVALGALFLARSWQASLVNPGGFQKEFHALSLGRKAAVACVVTIGLLLAVGGYILGAIAAAIIFAFIIQGLAVAHALVKQRGMHRFWLHGMYVLLILPMPHTWLLLASLGLVDNIHSLRRVPKES